MALRRSNWTLKATRPPTKRRTWATAKRNTAATTSRASHGARGRRRSRMTSSMITFWITGVKAETVRPRTATPKAVITSARWAMRYGHSRRIQPRDIRREYGRRSGYGHEPLGRVVAEGVGLPAPARARLGLEAEGDDQVASVGPQGDGAVDLHVAPAQGGLGRGPLLAVGL